VKIMTTATREALEHVSRILHEAGWDNPTPEPAELTDQELAALRTAYAGIRGDHLELLQRTLGAGERVEDVGRRMGLPPEQARSLFREALDRLRTLTTATL
jgi:DNA-directed RNA polymerase specialized sigma24 family protein